MIGKPVGTAFAELDLDTSKYDAKSRKVVNDAKESVVAVETAYKRLGVQHDVVFDAMQTRAYRAFHAIGVSAQSSFDEVARAYKATTAQMAASEIKFKGFVSESTILQQKDAVNAFYDGVRAKAGHTAQDLVQIERARAREIGTIDAQLYDQHEAGMAGMVRSVLRYYAAYYVISTAASALVRTLISGIEAIDRLKITQTSIAAQVTQLSSNRNLGEAYKEALVYAQAIVPVLEKIDEKSFASGEQIQEMARALGNYGVFLDGTNKKQVQSFTSLSNMVALLTAGQPNQFYQEMNGLLEGVVNKNNRVASQIDAQIKLEGIYRGGLKEVVDLGKQHGDLLQRLEPYLRGINAASKDIEGTWAAIKSSLETTWNILQREVLRDIYVEWNKSAKELNETLRANVKEISAGVTLFYHLAAGLGNLATMDLADTQKHATSIGDIIKNAYRDRTKASYTEGLDYGSGGNATPPPTNKPKTDPFEILGIKSADEYDKARSTAREAYAAIYYDASKSYQDRVTAYRAMNEALKKIDDDQYGRRENTTKKEKSLIDKSIQEALRLQESWAKTSMSLAATIEDSGLDSNRQAFNENMREAEKLKDQYSELPPALRETAYAMIDKAHAAKDAAVVEKMAAQSAKDYSGELERQAKAAEEAAAAQRKLLEEINGIAKNTFSGNTFDNDQANTIGKSITALEEMNRMYEEQAGIMDKLAAARAKINAMSDDTDENRIKKAQAYAALLEEEREAGELNAKSQLSAYRTLFGATAEMFDENSRARKAMNALEIAFTTAEIAMQMEKNLMIAVGAIANQGNGDPYSAFGRIAAMTSVMAGVLAIAGMTLGGGGSSSSGSGSSVVKKPYVGMDPESSESATNSLALLEDTYSMEYSKLTSIYDELKDLNNNITAIVRSVVSTGGVSNLGVSMGEYESETLSSLSDALADGITGFVNLFDLGLLGLGDKLSGGVSDKLGNIFGKTEKKSYAIGQGIYVGEGGDEVGNYIRWLENTKTTKGGSTKRTQTLHTKYEENDELNNLFNGPNGVFTTLRETVGTLLGGLGGNAALAESYKFASERINLKGLTTDEINEKLTEYISTVSDKMVKDLLGSIVTAYQEVNEGLLETAVRLYTDKTIITEILENTNMSFSKTASEAIALSESLIEIAGDLETLQDSYTTYMDAFFSDEEKHALLQGQLTDALAEYNLSLPDTREGYRKLVEAQKLNTTAGQEAYVALLGLAEAADEFYGSADEAISKWEDFADAINEWLDSLSLNSKLAPAVSMEGYRGMYEKYKSAATSTGASSEDVNNYLSYAETYLEFMRAYGGDYQRIYDQVTSEASTLAQAYEEQATVEEQQLSETKKQTTLLEKLVSEVSSGASLASSTASSGAASIALPLHGSGGLASRLSIAGDEGPEWIVPTYEPQRSTFLKNAPAEFWNNLGTAMSGGGSGGEQTIIVPVSIDGKEICRVVAKGIPRDPDLTKAVRRAA